MQLFLKSDLLKSFGLVLLERVWCKFKILDGVIYSIFISSTMICRNITEEVLAIGNSRFMVPNLLRMQT